MRPQRFRKRPVVIEAVRVERPWNQIADFCPTAVFVKERGGALAWISIPTLEGDHRADIGDWIIRGVAGEFYPCKPDIFEATYEALAAAEETKPSV